MKKKMRKLLSLFISLSMMASGFTLNAMAADETSVDTEPVAVTESQTDEITPPPGK